MSTLWGLVMVYALVALVALMVLGGCAGTSANINGSFEVVHEPPRG